MTWHCELRYKLFLLYLGLVRAFYHRNRSGFLYALRPYNIQHSFFFFFSKCGLDKEKSKDKEGHFSLEKFTYVPAIYLTY